MYNPETMSEREIRLHQMRIDQSYSHRLTYAACLLQRMKAGNLDAFAQARKEFPEIINEQMSLKTQYNKLWGYVKFGRPYHHRAEDDEYCSGECWQSFFDWRREQSRN